jgi:tRNA (Thr-GGU) A37 N-methylase
MDVGVVIITVLGRVVAVPIRVDTEGCRQLTQSVRTTEACPIRHVGTVVVRQARRDGLVGIEAVSDVIVITCLTA